MATYVKGDAVANATSYKLFNDGTEIATNTEINFNVTELITAEGEHKLTVKAYADGYTASDASNEVVFTVSASGGSGGNTGGGTTGGDTGGNTGGGSSDVSFTNDDFELGAYDASGAAVEMSSRYRTKSTKTFNQDVTFTASTLSGETSPCSLRFLEYNGDSKAMSAWITDSYTVPANTEFHLILARAGQSGNVLSERTVTVPTGATKLYVNALKSQKANAFVIANGQTISGADFTDGIYYYGTTGSAMSTLTTSSKASGYPSAISVSAGQSVVIHTYTDGTYGYVFTDDAGTIISFGASSDFLKIDYQPLDFFTYE